MLEKMYKMPELHPSHFLQAIDLFRQNFEHCAFVVVSDTMEWAMDNIVGRSTTAPVFPAGTGDPKDRNSIGIDLAILSQAS
jgi:hypothetical protein